MSQQIDYQILLQEVVKTAKEAAAAAKAAGRNDIVFGYHDILDVIKTQAENMEVPLAEIGLDNIDLDDFLP